MFECLFDRLVRCSVVCLVGYAFGLCLLVWMKMILMCICCLVLPLFLNIIGWLGAWVFAGLLV